MRSQEDGVARPSGHCSALGAWGLGGVLPRGHVMHAQVGVCLARWPAWSRQPMGLINRFYERVGPRTVEVVGQSIINLATRFQQRR